LKIRQVTQKSKIRDSLLRLGSERDIISEQIRTSQLSADHKHLLLFLVRVTPWCLMKLKKRTLQLGTLKDLLWGKKSESARDILKEINAEAAIGVPADLQGQSLDDNSSNPMTEAAETKDSPAPDNVVHLSHGKRKYPKGRKSTPRGQAAFPDVIPNVIYHTQFKSGDDCPKCEKGRLYPIKMGVFLKWVGQPALKALIYLQQKFRCNACGWITGAKMPLDVVADNGSESASAMIAVLKYGCGFPFFRLSKLQGWLKMPISPSTLWNQLKDGLIEVVEIIWKQMRKLAAQGEVIHNDDTVGKVLSLMEKVPKDSRISRELKPNKKPRKAISTTGILSKVGNIRILLFFTGHANAGENLEELLKARDESLKPPTQMSDASTMNRPGQSPVEESLCLTHGRRGFIRAYRSAKKACAFVILKLQEVYRVEAEAKREGLNPDQRLKLHQEKSGPVMEELKTWFDLQIETKQVEPNSALGEAIEYMRNHWSGLTAFLKIPGAPLTNDELEQAFKNMKTFLKNALFYKTLFGAQVGDMMMSVIHTTVLCGENPWEYLVEIQKNREAVKRDPGAWMPWNFRQAIGAAGESQISASCEERAG
jgi:transposase